MINSKVKDHPKINEKHYRAVQKISAHLVPKVINAGRKRGGVNRLQFLVIVLK